MHAIAAYEAAHLRHGGTRNKANILAFNHALKVYAWLFAELMPHSVRQTAVPTGIIVFVGFVTIALLSGSTNPFSFLGSLTRGFVPITLRTGPCVAAFIELDSVLHRIFCNYSRERAFTADADAAKTT